MGIDCERDAGSETHHSAELTMLPLESSKVWVRAQGLYAKGHRSYHTFQHAIDVLTRVDKISKLIGFHNYDAVRVAALFHDSIYVVGKADNEEMSAVVMKKEMHAAYEMTEEILQVIDDAHSLILATGRHMTHKRFYDDWDTMLFMDCDILGLAQDWETFQKNSQDIKSEFTSSTGFTEAEYETGRTNFLTNLYRKGIFRSPYFKMRYEDSAKANIKASLLLLGISV